jgi:amidase
VFEGYQPDKDAFQVAKMRAAGAIIIGKTNLSEFANSGRHSESPWGQVWNAIQPSSTAQGSSGGPAAAIGASFAAFGMGSQTGVSLYAPSAAAGLVSLRGTDGMSSGSGVAPLTFLQDYAGALARTTTDLAKILNVTTGTDPDDPGTVQGDADHKRPKDWTTALDPDALVGAKIGIISSQYTTPSYGTQGSIDRYNSILAQLKAKGVELVEMTGSVAAPPSVPGNLGSEGWFEWIRTHPNSPYATPAEIINSPKKLPYNRSTNSTAVDMTDAQVQAARDRRTAYKANWKAYLDANGVDAVLYPGNTSDFSDNDTAALGASFGSPPTSNIGIPGMVVPVGLNDHGHPLSMQFVGRAWDDAKMLGFGYALEQLFSSAIIPTKLPKLRYDPTATPKPIEIKPLPQPETKAPVPLSEPVPPTVPATVPSGATAKPPFLARQFKVTVKRSGRMTFTTSGSILLPSGMTRAAACNGSVRVIMKAGNRTLSTRRVPLQSKCTFKSKLTFGARTTLRGVSRLTVQVQFLGNAQLKRQTAALMRVAMR